MDSDTKAEIVKPPYRVPSMAEIAAVPASGLKAVGLFAGAGGSDLGLRMAGFRVLYANEFIEEAANTYAANHPGVYLDRRDIRDVSAAEICGKAGIRPGQLDVLEGSPPCSSFSAVGLKDAAWGQRRNYSGKQQRTDDLFDEFIRLLGDLRPRAFIAENVAGLISGTSRGKFLEFLERMKLAGLKEQHDRRLGSDAPGGYQVIAHVLDAQWLGVPQSRERLFFCGVRRDVVAAAGCGPALPKPLPYRYTLADACPWLATPDAWETSDDPAKPTPDEIAAVDISEYPLGKEAMTLQPGSVSRKYHSLIRSSANRPAYCVTQASKDLSTAGPIAPWGCRKFTPGELKRICSFPDDFVLTGNLAAQVERMGRAVPPLMAKAVGEKLREVLA